MKTVHDNGSLVVSCIEPEVYLNYIAFVGCFFLIKIEFLNV